ncbi:MAG: tRNA dihydrouridine synthase DusB [Ruminococcaceae bacterium]|nr:tRNA dihydrouridine synthase DusB [Oscillospiraceae bacterium]
MIKIGKLKISGAALAPMAGFTDSAFRQICKKMGAGLLVSEMVSAKALCFGDKKTAELLKFCKDERPLAIQLFASDADSCSKAAQLLLPHNPDIIDINMGCPVPKIVSSGCGSALLKNHQLAGQIVNKTVKSVSLPVSVKIRIGWDNNSLCSAELAKVLEDNGAAFLTVHGRTRDQMYQPPVNYDAIAKVKAAVKIPVIANGDILSAEDAKKVLAQTGCDGVMIGRGALGNPFIFREIKAAEENIPYTPPTFEERMDTVRELCALEIQNKGERLAMLELRRHLPFFFKGLFGAAEIRRRLSSVENRQELENIISDIMDIKNKEGK